MVVKQSFLLTCTGRIPDELCTGRMAGLTSPVGK